jgi:hypothetical protein
MMRTTPEQWAAILSDELARNPEAHREIMARHIRWAINETLDEAASLLSKTNYGGAISNNTARLEDCVRSLKLRTSACEVEPFAAQPEEPQYSEDGLIAIYPFPEGYKVTFGKGLLKGQTINFDDAALIGIVNSYIAVRSNRRG